MLSQHEIKLRHLMLQRNNERHSILDFHLHGLVNSVHKCQVNKRDRLELHNIGSYFHAHGFVHVRERDLKFDIRVFLSLKRRGFRSKGIYWHSVRQCVTVT